MKRQIIRIAVIIFVIFGVISILFYRGAGPKGLIAFVVDDWGYNKRYVDLVLEIDRPLTISILPNLRYSRYIAEEVKKNSSVHDIILHLPLESRSNKEAEVNTIRSSMNEEKIISILEKGIESVPGLIGVSNHQGSKATRDKRVMGIVLDELKKRELFFLDSLTVPDSVCSFIAHSIGLKHATRDVFLDLTDQTDLEHFASYIRGQIGELVSIAKNEGSAIGIAHNKRITLEVMKEIIPELEEQGIKIVPLKTLVR